jgi:hypothetical protein
MLIPFADAETKGTIFINPKQVSVVFEGVNPEGVQLTMINLLNGNVATQEPFLDVIGKLQAELKDD